MSTTTTINMIAAYLSMASPTLFLSGFFQSPPRNFHNQETVEIDISRSGEPVSIVLEDLSTGYRMNATDIYTNKQFIPPIHKEAVEINAFDLIKRMPGATPFESPDFRGNVITRIFDGIVKVDAKIKRAMELMSSQVLQSGVITLIDSAGDTKYALDFQPKATHFPTASPVWDGSSPTIAADIDSLAEIIRGDGLVDADQLLMGAATFEAFVKDSDIKARLDNRRINMGTIAPMEMRGKGGRFRGWIEIGNYTYEIWTYPGRYDHPSTGVSTQFLEADKCIVRASTGRMDMTFGAIPNIGRELGVTGTALLPELPSRISGSENGIDLAVNAWITESGEQMFAGVGARPLAIPTAIDTYGAIDTGV